MTSPLLAYVNAYLLATSEGTPEVTNGRIIAGNGTKYLIACYLRRQQSSGTTSGGDYIPTQTRPGDNLPGSSGVVYLYGGYALRYASVSNNYELGVSSNNGLIWSELGSNGKPNWLNEGLQCEHLHGNEYVKYCKIERLTGVYGNSGIDEIINKEIGGIPILVRSGDLID